MPQFHRLPIGKPCFPGPGHKLAQQRGVRPLRVLRLAAFVAQVLEKIFDQGLHSAVAVWPVNRS